MSQIGAGELVWGYDFLNGVWRLCRVECRHDANYNGPLVTIYADAGQVTATAFHPFWVIQGDELASRPTPRHVGKDEDQGGSLPGRWVNSHDLREGDIILLKGLGPVTLRRVVQRHKQTPVCNLTVEELHTFAVGEMQVLVHNTSGSLSTNAKAVIEETTTTTGQITSKLTLTADEALAAGESFLGEGYSEIGKPGSGVYRSADGLRQFRIDRNSLAGTHSPGVPHVHFETYAPGARFPTTNNHVPIK